MEICPIAYFESPFKSKFGIPRQSGLAAELRGRIVFEPEYRSADAIRGLEGFDYIWLIWGFSEIDPDSAGRQSGPGRVHPRSAAAEYGLSPAAHPADKTAFKATVRPPRLGGNERIGVFASRSPFRPNRLGLSSVRIVSIDPEGFFIEVAGADLMDGTPIYDIKPYVTYADSHPEARSGFVDREEWKPLDVVLAPGVEESGIDLSVIKEVLSLDPRPGYHDDPTKVYGMSFGEYDVRFTVDGNTLTVIEVK